MKILKCVCYLLGCLPWPFFISLLWFYFHAGKVLGHLPSYNQPDPKELAIYKLYAPYVDAAGGIWLLTFIPWCVLTIIYTIIEKRDQRWRPLMIGGIGQFLAIALLFSGIFEWYVD